MAVAAKILIANGASNNGGGGVPLPSFSFPNMPVGCIVADSTGQNWQLVISSATVDHTSVEKCAVNPALRWVTYAGGGGTVHVDSTMTGDGSIGSPLHAIPTFGADTTISLNNAISNPVTAWEGTASLTTTTAGAEVSKYVVKLLSAGAQVTAQDIRPLATLFPSGTAGLPGVAFQADATTGMFYDPTNGGRLSFSRGGATQMLLDGTNLWLLKSVIQIGGSADASIFYTGDRALQLRPNSAVSGGDVVIGSDGALSTSTDTGGYLQVPTCAGTPTATLTHLRSGKAAVIIDTTNHKIGYTTGAGTWFQTAALT